MRFLYRLKEAIARMFRHLTAHFKKKLFLRCGEHVDLGFNNRFYYQNMEVGNYVTFGSGSLFLSSNARIIIGDHVMFGPRVCVITGDHRIDVRGRTMDSVCENEKLPENDKDVIFEGDNWIGAQAIILKGVTVGKGAVIGAGSVVTKSIPPYSIAAGNPAVKIRDRFEA